MTSTPAQSSSAPPLQLPYPGAPLGAGWRRFWKKGVTFSGRASRSEFWKVVTLLVVLQLALYLALSFAATGAIGRGDYSGAVSLVSVQSTLSLIISLVIVIPSLAVGVRRLHDTDQSGAMYLLVLIPILGALILLVLLAQPSKPSGARFDAVSPSSAGTASPPAVPAAVIPPQAPPPAVVDRQQPVSASPAPPLPVPPAPPLPVQTSPVSAPPLADAPTRPVEEAPIDDDPELTRMAPVARTARWTAALSDGRELALDVPLIFGRNPSPDPARPGAALVAVDDPAFSMSKTHARVEVVGGIPQVTDLHSTNGTWLEAADGSAVAVSPGATVLLDAPGAVRLGDVRVRITLAH